MKLSKKRKIYLASALVSVLGVMLLSSQCSRRSEPDVVLELSEAEQFKVAFISNTRLQASKDLISSKSAFDSETLYDKQVEAICDLLNIAPNEDISEDVISRVKLTLIKSLQLDLSTSEDLANSLVTTTLEKGNCEQYIEKAEVPTE